MQIREFKDQKELLNVEELGYWQHNESDQSMKKLIDLVNAIELGRIVTRDIGGGDPERMTPQKVAEYVQEAFKAHSEIKMSVIEGQETFEKDYPLFAAVNRAADGNF